jgi:hypothetical protein
LRNRQIVLTVNEAICGVGSEWAVLGETQ